MKNLALSLLCVLPLAGCSGLGPDKGMAARPQSASLPAAGAMTARDETALYLNVIDGLIKQERYAAALAFLDGYAGREKTPQTRYWLMRGNALLGLNRPAEALPSFAKLEGTELSGEGWNGLGRVAAARFQWSAAAANFEKAVRISPANADFLNNLAFADMHISQTGAAVMHLFQARELRPESELIRNNLAIALTLSGNRAGAEEILGNITDEVQRRNARAIVQAAATKFAAEGKS